MSLLASTAIALAAIPLLSMLSLFGISAFVLNRRAACIDQERGRAEEEHAKTIRDEQEAEQAFVDSLLNGRSVPETPPEKTQPHDPKPSDEGDPQPGNPSVPEA